MTFYKLFKQLKLPALALVVLALTAAPSFAVDLAAVEAQWLPPGGTVGVDEIAMWAFVADTGSCPAGPVGWTSGPQLTAMAAGSLTVNLRNCLSEPVSVFIPGQLKATAPVTFVDGQGRTRVSSFDAVAPADAGATTTPYTWTNVKEGTYLYHSGTHPQVQVQMGLYGALVVTGTGYPSYNAEQVLLYSEIDPALHAAVAGGTYGTAAYPSTFDYYPQYFLINGEAYPNTSNILITTSQDVLLRFVNAGLKTHSPTLGGGLYMTLIAEDGNRYPFFTEQYGIPLPPAKTMDAILNIGANGTYTLYDRSLGLMNANATGGGMLTYLVAGAAAGAPTAVNDPAVAGDYTIAEDSGSLTTTAGGSPAGVLDNDIGGAAAAVLVSGPSFGTLSAGLAVDGSFSYTPNPNFNGTDQFTYLANDGAGGPDSNVATVTITVTPVNDPPTAVADAYDAVAGTTLYVASPGVLANDSDVDGDPLTATTSGIPPTELTAFNTDGSFTFDATLLTAGTVAQFDYVANDGTFDSLPPATVTVNVVAPPANQPPVAVEDTVNTPQNTVTPINVIANDYDPDGTIDAASVALSCGLATCTTTAGGTATVSGGGTVTFAPKNPGYRGTDTFTYTVNDNDGATSNVATVRVNVTR